MPLVSISPDMGEGNAGKVFQVLTRKPGDLPSRKCPCRRGVRKSGISGWWCLNVPPCVSLVSPWWSVSHAAARRFAVPPRL